ncbi:tetratricopeptide repeat protein [Luteolibacter sp. LG18]|uniref:tetratricopeptide repeat protein n=1 Tax=Luteolibacter sp. LG18 TaxID=2819286 RepID=UPI002B2E1644|nr:hypothetical protein llg_10800 [Luteolibacter sp. LG18]
MNRRILILASLLISCGSVVAHPDARESLQEIDKQLVGNPLDVSLLVAKAAVLRGVEELDAASKTLDEAERLAPASPEVALGRAQLLLACDNDRGARMMADAIVRAHPRFPNGWEFLASLQQKAGETDGAIDSLRKHLAFSERFHADDFTACARLLETRAKPGDREEAVRILDDGIAKLGCMTGLHIMAANLEVSLGRHDAALGHYDALAARYRPRPEWAVARAGILLQANRPKDAAAAFDAAIAMLDALPPARREGPEVVKLRASLVTQREAALQK